MKVFRSYKEWLKLAQVKSLRRAFIAGLQIGARGYGVIEP